MDEIIKQKLHSYMQLFNEIETETGDAKTARALLAEIAKDMRIADMQRTRQPKNNMPATQSQVNYLKYLGATIPQGMTRAQASKLIDSTKTMKDEANTVPEVTVQAS